MQGRVLNICNIDCQTTSYGIVVSRSGQHVGAAGRCDALHSNLPFCDQFPPHPPSLSLPTCLAGLTYLVIPPISVQKTRLVPKFDFGRAPKHYGLHYQY